jgi:GT2 family glycosyltransferase
MTSSALRTDHLVRPRHVVTAVLVAHDGARWLPTTLHAVKTQRRPVQRFVAVDTGSQDDTGPLLERAVGASSVIEAPRETGFGAAVTLATNAFAGVPGLASTRSDAGAPVEWMWLLHDDSAPAASALEAMLELADEMPSAAVIGAKLRGWDNRRLLLEVGVTLDHGGRRETSLEQGELDHGQHDGRRDVLAVSTAGMLVRRDVWDDLGALDPALPLFRDDVDFGWRANLAGHRVVVCTRAVVHHAQAAASGARRISCGPPQRRRLDRQSALWIMLANSPAVWLPWITLRLLAACLVRSVAFALTKRPFDAWDELRATVAVFGRPIPLHRARRIRTATRRVPSRDIRGLFAPPGTRLRHYADSAGERLSNIGRHGEGEAADERSVIRRLVTQPGLLLVLGLLIVSLVAQRHVLLGTLHGGALLPAPLGARDLWHIYTASWHDTGFGSTANAPPYLAILAGVATVLFGSARLAVKVLLLGSVPIAGLAAYVAGGRLAATKRLRVWLAATYALLPVATGAVAAGRLGTAVAFAVLPLVLLLIGQALVPTLYAQARAQRLTARRAGRRVLGARPAWPAALMLAIAAAFEPLVYVLLMPLIALALIVAAARLSWVGVRRAAIVFALPPVLLLPWSAQLLHHPSLAVLGVGQPRLDLQSRRLNPIDVLLLHPGGPGMPPVWLDAVVVVAALVGLLQLTRPGPAWLGWALALDGVVGGLLVARARVRAPGGAQVLAGWPGIATALIGAGLLMSVAVAAARLRARLTETDFGWRQPVVVAIVLAAVATPLAAAGWWVAKGTGPLLRTGSVAILPPFVVADSSAHGGARTVVLLPQPGGTVDYALLRQREAQLGDAELLPDQGQVRIVDAAVADLAAGVGQRAATELAHAGIRYVMAPVAADGGLGAKVAAGGGVLPQNTTGKWRVWEVQATAGRLAIAVAGDDDWQLPGGPMTVGRHAPPTNIPYSPSTRFLVLAEAPSPSWQALVRGGSGDGGVAAGGAGGSGGTPLSPAVVGGMQAFELPTTAADVVVSRVPDRRANWLTFQLVVLAIVLLGGIPSGRRADEQQRPRRPAEIGRAGKAAPKAVGRSDKAAAEEAPA